MEKSIFEAAAARRTVYAIGRGPGISDGRVAEIVRSAVRDAPSAFNSQSARTVLLLGGAHDALWDITLETLRPLVPADSWGKTCDKIHSFRAGRGTVLYFEDQATIRQLQEQFPSYRDRFPGWSLQSSGMLQYLVWVMLESEGLGVSLQHYNPLIDEKVKARFRLPESWELTAEMPFGSLEKPAEPKDSLPLEEKFRLIR